MRPLVVYSNRIERLYEHLRLRLFAADSSLFTKRLIIVPSQAMRAWLLNTMATDPELGCVAGVKICFAQQAMQALQDGCCEEPELGSCPDEAALALAIESVLRGRLISGEAGWVPIAELLRWEPGHSIYRDRRLTGLSFQLAQLFRRYGVYAAPLVEEWMRADGEHWQQQLYQLVYAQNHWRSHTQYLQELHSACSRGLRRPVQLHLFSMSFLPLKELEFFLQLTEQTQLCFYNLSPCLSFWTDLRSDRENRWIRKFWSAKGADDDQVHELLGYLRERNPLLANFGKLGRSYNGWLEELDVDTIEDYTAPSQCAQHPAYEDYCADDLYLSEQSAPLSLLEHLQADLLLMRKGDPENRIELDESDRSISIHKASSAWREVEILYDNLMQAIDQASHGPDPICPADILVMAPDITVYKPYIEAVFGSGESRLDYQLMDLEFYGQSSLAQSLRTLFTLALGRWPLNDFLELLEDPCFRKKAGFSAEELQHLRHWMHEAGIGWGQDQKHRNELLRHDALPNGMIEDSESGTWSLGLKRLLLGLCIAHDAQSEELLEAFPVEGLGMTDADLVGKILDLFQSLEEDLRSLADGSLATIEQWIDYLRCLCDTYFLTERSDREAIDSVFQKLLHSVSSGSAGKYPFSTVRFHLEQELRKTTVTARESHLQAVRFCSMLPMRAIPAKVIGLIGMSDKQYPRIERSTSLNCMRGRSDNDYLPSRTDYDRYLFLEAMLSARQRLLLSFHDSADQTETQPSLLISELLEELDRGYLLGASHPSDLLVLHHPFHRHHHSYYSGVSTELQGYSEQARKLALVRYGGAAEEPRPFMRPGSPCDQSAEDEIAEINIAELTRALRSPLSIYFRENLHLSMSSRFTNDDEEAREYSVKPWVRSVLRKEQLLEDELAPLNRAEKLGMLPLGVFKQVLAEDVRFTAEDWKQAAAEAGWALHPLQRLQYSSACQQPERVSDQLVRLPAPCVKLKTGEQVFLVGEQDLVGPQGQLFLGYGRPADFLRAWVPHLLLSQLQSGGCDLFGASTLSIKDGKSFTSCPELAEQSLARVVEFYRACVKAPCPLPPDLLVQVPSRSTEEWQGSLKASLAGVSAGFGVVGPELEWLADRDEDMELADVVGSWKQVVSATLDPMLEHCFATRKERS